MKKIGIFSGSFNPVHIGHLALANWICEYGDLDEVRFLVTPQNPLKDKEILMDYDLRFTMVKEAIADYHRFSVSDFECTLPVPSYTIDTLRALRRAEPDCLFHLILGADSWANFNLWKDAQALIDEFRILIYPRNNYEQTEIPQSPHIRKVDAPLLDVSSSFIRAAIRDGKDIRFFLPEAVRKYIHAFNLHPNFF